MSLRYDQGKFSNNPSQYEIEKKLLFAELLIYNGIRKVIPQSMDGTFMYLPNPSARAGCDTVNFKRSLTGLSSI